MILDMGLLQVVWYGLLAGWLTVHLARLKNKDQESALASRPGLLVAFCCPAAAVCRRSLVEGRSLSAPCRLCPAPLTLVSRIQYKPAITIASVTP
jgi:hypothetical protein